MYNRQYMLLSNQNAVSTITWHALRPQLVSHQNLKVNSVKKITQVRFSGANLCTDTTHVSILCGLLILWFMGTLKIRAKCYEYSYRGHVSHAVGGAQASRNPDHLFNSDQPWRSQPCLWRCHASSSSPALKIQMKSSAGGNMLLSYSLPPAKPELERKRLYLIVSTLKVGLCLTIFGGWGSNEHLTLSPSTGPFACRLCSELFTECRRNGCFLPAPGVRAPMCVHCPAHCQFQRLQSALTTGQRHPDGQAGPGGPAVILCPVCWVLA